VPFRIIFGNFDSIPNKIKIFSYLVVNNYHQFFF
jgi:hypothetical protein